MYRVTGEENGDHSTKALFAASLQREYDNKFDATEAMRGAAVECQMREKEDILEALKAEHDEPLHELGINIPEVKVDHHRNGILSVVWCEGWYACFEVKEID